ncbi:MAG: AraC family transcriptional regulator [Christensenellaceae bacterium]
MKKIDLAMQKSCNLIKNALDVNCFVEDVKNMQIPPTELCEECAKLQAKYGVDKQCAKLHADSAFQSEKWGGKYEYLCPLGLCFVSSGIPIDAELRYAIIAGPFFMVDFNEFTGEDLPNMFHNKSTPKILNIAKRITYIPCHRVTYIADMINIVAKNTAANIRSGNLVLEESDDASKRIYELIYKHKDLEDAMTIQLELENRLMNNIKLKNREKSQKLLNEILGGIYFNSFGDLKIIKARVTELVVGLVREAVSSGAGMDNAFALSGDYIAEIQKLGNIRELDMWLAKVLNNIMFSVLPASNLRHTALVQIVKNYIAENYMKKISLNELADLAGFSVSYLSKIFKEETQKSISSYINHERIESAKKLLKTTDISLVDLAYVVGFEEQSYFTKVFKKLEGVSPGRYRDVNTHIKQ